MMYGFNEDAYWDDYQVRHDPQWHSEDEYSESEYTEWDEADRIVDDMLYERDRHD